MIDLDAIEKECQQMIADGLGFIAPKSCGNAEAVAALLAELRKDRKDAARYRWLRESASIENHGGLAYDFQLVDAIRYMPGAAPNETMDVDEAIDEAMKCEQ